MFNVVPLFLKLRHIKNQTKLSIQYCFDKISIHTGSRHKPPLLQFRSWFFHALRRQKEKLTFTLLLDLIYFLISISSSQDQVPALVFFVHSPAEREGLTHSAISSHPGTSPLPLNFSLLLC